MKRRIFSLIFLGVLVCALAGMAAAAAVPDDGVMPCYNNTMGTSTNFTITTDGLATVTAVYNGHTDVTYGARVTSYIEKRTLGLFWNRVDIGQPNNEWVDTSSALYDVFGHEFQLTSKGTYRATVTYEVCGNGGPADIINYQQERTYS